MNKFCEISKDKIDKESYYDVEYEWNVEDKSIDGGSVFIWDIKESMNDM